MADTQEWAPVAEKAVGVFGQVSQPVQITFTIGVFVVLLAGIAAWFYSRRKPEDDHTVPAGVLISVTEEFSRQVGHMTTVVEGLAEVVEEMRDTIKGCSTCHFNPHSRGDHVRPDRH